MVGITIDARYFIIWLIVYNTFPVISNALAVKPPFNKTQAISPLVFLLESPYAIL